MAMLAMRRRTDRPLDSPKIELYTHTLPSLLHTVRMQRRKCSLASKGEEMKTTIALATLSGALITCGAFLLLQESPQQAASAQQEHLPFPAPVRTEGKAVPLPGHVSKIEANKNAEVTDVLVREGDRVKKGQLLVIMKEARGTLDAAEAALEAAKLQLAVAKASATTHVDAYRRAQKLLPTAIALQELVKLASKAEAAQLQVVVAEKRVEEAKGNVKKALTEFAYFRIHARTDGAVDWLRVTPGQVGRVIPAITWGEIINLDMLQVTCSVPIATAQKLAIGRKVQVWPTPRANPLPGTITLIGWTVHPDGSVPVTVEFRNNDWVVRRNQTVVVRFGEE